MLGIGASSVTGDVYGIPVVQSTKSLGITFASREMAADKWATMVHAFDEIREHYAI